MRRKMWVLPLILFILSGCANVTITSNKDATYAKTLDRTLITISLDKTYLNGQKVALGFTDQLAKRGVTVQTVVPNPLELEIGTRAVTSTFRPTQALVLVATSVTSNQYGPIAFTLDGSIYDVESKKRIWRSAIRFSGNLGDAQQNADKFVTTVVQKLEADGLLPSASQP